MLSLFAQVAIVVTMTGGQATTLVSNPSRMTQHVTVGLFYGEVKQQADGVRYVELGRAVTALVSPATFALAPGEAQTVRIRLKEVVPAGTVLRLVTTFEPQHADEIEQHIAAPVTVALKMKTRFISRVETGP